MMRDTRLLLASLAIGVTMLGVVSGPSASAAVWKHEGVNLTKFIELGLTGEEVFEAGVGNGMVCEVHATLTTEGGNTGTITKFETKKCPMGFGTFAKCSLATSTSLGLPWTVDVKFPDLRITDWHIHRTFKAGCATAELDKTIGSVTGLPETPAAISTIEFLGEATGYKMFSVLHVDGTNAGTYGIG